MTTVCLAFLLLGLGFTLDLVARGRTRVWRVIPLGVAALAATLLAVSGALAVRDGGQSASLEWLFGQLGPGLQTGLTVDRLAGMFLLLTFSVAVPALLVVAAWSWQQPSPFSTLPAAVCLLLAACATTLLAKDLFTLVLGWELLTASFYWLTAPGRHRSRGSDNLNASIATVAFGKASGAVLLLGGLLLAADSGSTNIASLGEGSSGPVRATGYALMVLAFAIKVGLVPVQIWMPRGYSAAPGPARALMSGVAVNVGFYGLWRVLEVLGPAPDWLAILLLLLGAVTGLLGIAHATIQTHLTGIVAYSSVENAGLIVTAYGVALIGVSQGMPRLVSAGLLAATLQVVAHAVGKTLLFASAGVIESRLGTDELDDLRGVARQLPWSGTGLTVGAVTMAGLPPTVLFVSEWFILEALMQQFRLGGLRYTLPLALAGALVALTSGFAGVAFVRLAAFVALGHTSGTPRTGPEVGIAGKVGLAALIVACPGIAAITPVEIHLIASGLSGIVPESVTNGAVPSPWVLGPVYRNFSALSPTWLAIELPTVLLLVLGLVALLSRGRMFHVRRVDVWRSATGGVDGADEYTPFGYANPTRKVLANVLLTRTEIERHSGGLVHQHEQEGAAGVHLGYTSDVVEVTEAFLYRPLFGGMRWLMTMAIKLQSGRLEAYLLYMLIALVIVLVVAVA